MNSSTEEIKSRINVVDLIGEYIKLQKAGVNWKAPCPFHNEKTPSFVVSEEKQIWHCFGCQKGGDAFGFLMELEGIEFKESLRILAEKAGIDLPKYDSKTSNDKNKTLEILEIATKFYEKQLWDGPGKEKILKYLEERGLKNETIKEFRLGYAPNGWNNIIDFLSQRGYTREDMMKTGLLVEKEKPGNDRYYDRFRDRIMFPISDPMGNVVGFSARVSPGGDESQAKYVNTPETDVYHKSKILYGIDKAKMEIKNKDFVLLVEGNTDVTAAYQAGIRNTVAVSGTALTSDQLDILKRYTENIKMLFDMDDAGQLAAVKSAQIAFQKELNVFIVELQGGKDAAEVAAKNLNNFLDSVKGAVPAMEYFFEAVFKKYDKAEALGKKNITKELLNIINNIANKIEKSHWIKKLAQLLDVEENILNDILNKDKVREKKAVAEKDGQDIISDKKRAEIMRDKIIGLMLADKSVWKKISEIKEDSVTSFLRADTLFEYLTENGNQSEFKFDNILLKSDNKEISDKMRKFYFDAKYQFDIQSGIKENTPTDNWAQAEQYIKDINKELCKDKMEIISKDLKKAENDGDKEAVSFLNKEFSKISQELNC